MNVAKQKASRDTPESHIPSHITSHTDSNISDNKTGHTADNVAGNTSDNIPGNISDRPSDLQGSKLDDNMVSQPVDRPASQPEGQQSDQPEISAKERATRRRAERSGGDADPQDSAGSIRDRLLAEARRVAAPTIVLKTVTIKMDPTLDQRIEDHCHVMGKKKQDLIRDAVLLYFETIEALK